MEDLIKNYLNLSAAKQKLVETMLKEKGIEITDLIILPQHRNGKPFPASFAQGRLWFLEQFEPGSPLYIIPIAVKVKGKLNFNLLERTINKIIERHEILRTSFKSVDGKVYQVIHPSLKIKIKQKDFSININIDEELTQIILRESTEPFDLTAVPLLRVTIIKINSEEQIIIIPMHHIISDNWSTAVFVKELLEIYKAFGNKSEINLEPLPIQYADFSVWQQERFKKNIYKKQANYWVNKLKNSNKVLDIITDYKHPSVQTFNGSFEIFAIQSDILEKINRLAKSTDTTLFMILISVFQVMLYRFTNQDDINIGTPIANRNRAEIEGLIGFFINTLVMRGNLSGNPTFKELLERTKETALEAYQNQDVPFEDIVDKLKLERDISHTALFQAMFVLNNARMEKLELPGIEFEVIDTDTNTTKFDLVLSVTQSEEMLNGKFEYNTDLFHSYTIKQMIKAFQNILSEIANNSELHIDEIKLGAKADLSILIAGENVTNINSSVIELINKTAVIYSDKTAISLNENSLTYRELISKINKLSNHLKNKNVAQGDVVSVYLERSIEYVIAMLSIMNIGATYLPLDVDYPKERLEYLLSDSDSKYIISKSKYFNDLEDHKSKIINISEYESDNEVSLLNTKTESENTAYIIYTSGSTGKPKGVEVTHAGLAKHIQIMQKHFDVTADDKELEFAAFNFDASIEQILVPLISGAELFLRDNNIWTAPEFTRIIKDEKLTIINPPTIVWEELTKYWYENPEEAPSKQLKLCIAGGDEMKADLIAKWMKSPMKNVRLLNAYGPTEGIITVSTSEINNLNSEKLFRTPVGKPLPDRKFYVVDKNLKILPKGFPGELCICGDILAKGYLRRGEITKEKFIVDLFDKERTIYRTGDLVRINEYDEVEFIGRVDKQVKIRGFRIEPGEIESILRNYNLIDDAIVIALDKNGNKYLVAYIITNSNKELELDKMKNYLKKELPEYMVPHVFMKLDKFPLTPSGKIDKKALPKPEGTITKLKTKFVMPRTETEAKITNIVSNVLNIEKVGIYDNFFELGGHSMLAMQVISKISQEFEAEISIRALFENPTVDGIAKALAVGQINNVEEYELRKLLDDLDNMSDSEIEKELNN